MFRVPEKRPPKAVSTAFTVLIFVPLVIMLVVVSSFLHTISYFNTNGLPQNGQYLAFTKIMVKLKKQKRILLCIILFKLKLV